jgi:SH3-like domain-containing protein
MISSLFCFLRALSISLMLLLGIFILPGQAIADESSLPLPRFVSLRGDLVNLRSGPGVQYPVEWVYQRKNLPVEIIAEYRTWRKIRDWQSIQGWVHQSVLSGRRTVIIIGKRRSLRSSPDTKSPPVALIEASAIATLDQCPTGGGWCRVQAESIQGWLRKVEFWGAYRNEVLK